MFKIKRKMADSMEDWPRLTSSNHTIESPPDSDYNCFAWAASTNSQIWSPYAYPWTYWPPDVPRELSESAVIAAFSTLGYAVVSSSDPEPGVEKVAIFVNEIGEPVHMARQLKSGVWASKMGDFEDIEHSDLHCVGGGMYGTVSVILGRKLTE